MILGILSGALGALLVLWWRYAATTGTKSVLLGAHCFFLHPWFVAWGWFRVYGFRRVKIGTRTETRWVEVIDGRNYGTRYPRIVEVDEYASLWRPALWVAFFVHDIGYFGKPNMDDEEGEQHPSVGAAIVAIFDRPREFFWHDLVYFHSRFLAKRYGVRPSPLCMADKLALALDPWWLYLPRVMITGEAREYSFHHKRDHADTKWSGDPLNVEERRLACSDSIVDRVLSMQMYTRRWVAEHMDGREDKWTPGARPVRAEAEL